MPLTPNSSLTPYIQPSELLSRYDYRAVGMLVSDDNTICSYTTPATQTYANILAQISNTSTIYYANFNTTALGASGELESACLKGDRYQPPDLQALITQGGVSAGYLKDIVAALQVMRLYNRRGGLQPSDLAVKRYEVAQAELLNLANGSSIFSFQETEDAGVPDSAYLTHFQILRQQFMPTAYRRAFGIRKSLEYPAGWPWGGSF